MSETPPNPLEILQKLEALLVKEGYDTDRPARKTIASLREALKKRGYKETILPQKPTSYTTKRAQSLRSLSVKLRDTLIANTKEGTSYTDRASTLSTVSNSYLQLAHAFKVDSKVWSFAQEDLVPILSAAVDEKTLDEAVSRLLSHLERYLKSLDKWLSK